MYEGEELQQRRTHPGRVLTALEPVDGSSAAGSHCRHGDSAEGPVKPLRQLAERKGLFRNVQHGEE